MARLKRMSRAQTQENSSNASRPMGREGESFGSPAVQEEAEKEKNEEGEEEEKDEGESEEVRPGVPFREHSGNIRGERSGNVRQGTSGNIGSRGRGGGTL
eukprot:1016897-Prorocentrum_minimum.AAC.1